MRRAVARERSTALAASDNVIVARWRPNASSTASPLARVAMYSLSAAIDSAQVASEDDRITNDCSIIEQNVEPVKGEWRVPVRRDRAPATTRRTRGRDKR